MTKLSINLNKVALLRNQRDIGYPSVLGAAQAVIAAGAHGITVHPRPDERHIRRSDVTELAEMLAERYGPRVEYNIEGYPDARWIELVERVRPTQATLVPDSPDQRTSDHGWDLAAKSAELKPIIARLKAAGCRISLFMDADPADMERARGVGADRVELYTGPYGETFGSVAGEREFKKLVAAGEAARDAGLGLNAGHDLNLDNLPKLRAALPWLLEVSIGHAFTADALRLGYGAAIQAYLVALDVGDRKPRRVA